MKLGHEDQMILLQPASHWYKRFYSTLQVTTQICVSIIFLISSILKIHFRLDVGESRWNLGDQKYKCCFGNTWSALHLKELVLLLQGLTTTYSEGSEMCRSTTFHLSRSLYGCMAVRTSNFLEKIPISTNIEPSCLDRHRISDVRVLNSIGLNWVPHPSGVDF